MAAPAPTEDMRPFPTPKEAFDEWQANRQMGFRALADHLQSKGFRCSKQWLQKTKDSYDPWLEAYTVFRTENVSPERILSTLELASKTASEVTAESLLGVKGRLIAVLFQTLEEIPVPDAATWQQLLDCGPKLDALIHTHRGIELASGTGKTSSTKKDGGSLMAQFGPKPTIAPITVKPGAH